MRTIVMTIALALVSSTPALADATAFIGANTTPSNRMTAGIAVGLSLAIIGLEAEYADTAEDQAAAAPSLKTGMLNVFVQTPVAIAGFQPYLTAGAGIYRETLATHEDTSAGLNVGGGIKFALVGPLRLRADYRMFTLGSGALASPAHRLYVGLNLKF